MSGLWDALDPNMALYRFHVQKISGYFEGCEFRHVPRVENEAADVLSKLGSTRQAIPPGVALEHLRKPSIRPSLETDSIYVPEDPESGTVPMYIDMGGGARNPGTASANPRTASVNPGTTSQDPGTAQHDPVEVMPVDQMEIDEDVFPV